MTRARLRRSLDRRSGQTAVEYMLLIAAVVGFCLLIQQLVQPYILEFVANEVQFLQERAWVGGAEPNGAGPHTGHYAPANGACATGRGQGCAPN
jgi:hypothetical protein